MGDVQDHVIRRNGGFYRPSAKGYTLSIAEAGRWSREEALAYQHNVEGVTIHHVSEFKPDRLSILMNALEKIASGTKDETYPLRAMPREEMQRIARDSLAEVRGSDHD